LFVEVNQGGEHGLGEGSPMTVGFLYGQSDYEIDPLARLDYVELGFKPNS
jgi:hypothetical protein